MLIRLSYRFDFANVNFICYEKIVVELKAVTPLVKAHTFQVLNYLKVLT
ncbi:MAG: GxxExxY protein [Treponema sp.]|nr:GxxExxY protein [Treponema sp.]